jgi:ABC-type polar amino acid transport system ATPase subunit
MRFSWVWQHNPTQFRGGLYSSQVNVREEIIMLEQNFSHFPRVRNIENVHEALLISPRMCLN